MSKKLENTRTCYRIKYCIVYVLFLVLTVREIYASKFSKRNERKASKQKAALQRTIDVLKVQNSHFDVNTARSDNSDNQYNPNTSLVRFDINKYKHMEDLIFNFDDSIRYNYVLILGDKSSPSGLLENPQNLCLRFIKAFGNLRAKRLFICDIYPHQGLSLFGNLFKDSIPNGILDIEEIVFQRVCKRFALKVLTLFQFKQPVKVVFTNYPEYADDTSEQLENIEKPTKAGVNIESIKFNHVEYGMSINILESLLFNGPVEIIYDNTNEEFEKYYWSHLTRLPAVHKYKRIEMFKIEYFNALNESLKEKLKEILPVLYIQSEEDLKTDDFCAQLKNIVRRSKLWLNEIEVSDYPELKSQLVYTPYKYRYLTLNATSIITNLNRNESIIKNTEETAAPYNYIRPKHSFEVKIIVKDETLTAFGVKKVLEWAAEHINNATKIVIVYTGELHNDISVFKSVRIEVENMPHLEYISLLDHRDRSYKDTTVITDVNCKEKYVTTMTTFTDSRKYTLGLPLNLYVHGSVEILDRWHPIQYPTRKRTDILKICKKCDLKVFNYKERQEELKSTDKVLSLEEVKPMTWNKFLVTPNRKSIEKHLKTAYDLDRDISLNENNFTEVLKYVLEKPIFILPYCLHTICAGCLHEKTRIKTAIKCMSCKELRDLSVNFRYFVNEQNINNIQNKYVYSMQVHNRKTHYVLYECAPFQSSKYYFKSLQEITKPNLIIRKDESITIKQ